jgi:hypothetical protein
LENLKDRPLGGSKCVREGDINIDLKEIGWKGVERIHMATVGSCEQSNDSLDLTKYDWLSNH